MSENALKAWPQPTPPKDALTVDYGTDLTLYSLADAIGLLIGYFGGSENLHFLLRVHKNHALEVETDISHYRPDIPVDIVKQDDVDEWELVGFRYTDGRFWTKSFWNQGV